MVQLLAIAPLAGIEWTPADVERAARAVASLRARGQAYQPKFFTAHEYQTVRVLVDLIIPKDERSGGATDAGVPEFMDFIVGDQASRQTAMRAGLARHRVPGAVREELRGWRRRSAPGSAG